MESSKNHKSVCEIIINIEEEKVFSYENLVKVPRCNFISFLCNGSTDSSTSEKELICIIVLDPDTHEVQLKFFP